MDHQLAGERGKEMKMVGRREGGNSRVMSNLPQGGSGLKGCVGGVGVTEEARERSEV